jgi:TolB-like protein
MKINFKIYCIFLLLALVGNAHADPLKGMAKKMVKKMEDLPNRKIAVLGFPYHNGYVSSGSSIVQERLTTFLAQTGRVELVERNLLDKIMEEMSLEISGIIDENTTKELGRVLGVGGLVTGTLNDIGSKKTEVNARIIDVQTGRILTASRAKIKRTWPDSPGKPDERTQLWKIVNELASSERGGDNPVIQVALYEYGNSRISSGENYITQVLPFTADLDMVSEKLFSLTTSGGQEYCGAVIMDAVKALRWDGHTDVYKVIFIAGNEPFTQGPVDFRGAVKEAVGKDIFVNTIFCGNKQQGIATKWKDGADGGNGEYMNIDQGAKVVAVRAPQDARIRELGANLNRTFVFYGSAGRAAEEKQDAQDRQAMRFEAAGAPTQRSLFKAKAQYSQSVSGDLVNDVSRGKVKIEDIKKENLPAELQKMHENEIKEYVEKKAKERQEIQEKIERLNEERKNYIAREREKMTTGRAGTLDEAVLNAVRAQAVKKKFVFK